MIAGPQNTVRENNSGIIRWSAAPTNAVWYWAAGSVRRSPNHFFYKFLDYIGFQENAFPIPAFCGFARVAQIAHGAVHFGLDAAPNWIGHNLAYPVRCHS